MESHNSSACMHILANVVKSSNRQDIISRTKTPRQIEHRKWLESNAARATHSQASSTATHELKLFHSAFYFASLDFGVSLFSHTDAPSHFTHFDSVWLNIWCKETRSERTSHDTNNSLPKPTRQIKSVISWITDAVHPYMRPAKVSTNV